MILYREHTSSIHKSMNTLIEFDNLECLFKYLNKRYCFTNNITAFAIQPYFMKFDSRIGWKNTFVVCYMGCAGFGWITDTINKADSLLCFSRWLCRGN